MKYLSNKKTAYVSVMAVMLLGLSACGGGGSSAPATGGGTTGGAMACTDIPGEPDILGDVTYSVNPVAAGTTLTVNIPVDVETAYVEMLFLDVTTGLGFRKDFAIASQAQQTLNLDVSVDPVANPGSYKLNVALCTDAVSCPVSDDKPAAPAGAGVAVLYHELAGNNIRDKIWDSGPAAVSSVSCGALPAITVQ